MAKPQLVRGTRDFGPSQVLRRQYLFDTLRQTFVEFGFNALETPAMERLETLTGKYGDEGEGLLFKILNNGDFWSKVRTEKGLNSPTLLPQIAERGLRYDLTVPFARFLSMNRNDISFPFKRYQIQPVWRGDNPQHGRYREFYQCDVDVAGSNSLLYEAELLQIYDIAFSRLGIQVVLRLNNRKILEGLAQAIGKPEALVPITVAIDKLDKIGRTGVSQELEKLGIETPQIETIFEILNCQDLTNLAAHFEGIEVGQKGIEEIQNVLNFLKSYNWKNTLQLDFSLARGLSYYTGCIFEVIVNTQAAGQESVKMGSIGGGGRYDNLTGVFGLPDVSGVGISFGADRIYDVLEQIQGFKDFPQTQTQLLLLSMDAESLIWNFELAGKLRATGLAVALYPEAAKFKKQMDYANKTGVKYVGIVGSEELGQGKVKLKNMITGEQSFLSPEELPEYLK